MRIEALQIGHPLWPETISFSKNCSWRAGVALAEKMINNDFLPWERVFVAADGNRIAGFCTLAERDELPEGYTFSPFIGFIFVDEQYRGQRLSGRMIAEALRYAGTLGHQNVYIMSGETGLYEKYGFEKIGDYETIYGSIDQLFRIAL